MASVRNGSVADIAFPWTLPTLTNDSKLFMICSEMSSAETSLSNTAECPETADGWERALAMRQLQVLGELAEQGLEIGRVIEARAKAAQPGDGVDLNALAMAHARVARAVRMGILLQSRLIADMQAFEEHAARKAAARAAAQARRDPDYVHKARVEGIVERVAKAEFGDDEDEIDRLAAEASERLDDDDIYGEVLNRPIGELVALICRDLGLRPDWARLAEEAWAREEIESGAAGSPFARPPPLAGEVAQRAGEGACRIAAERPLSHFVTAPPPAGEHATSRSLPRPDA